MMTSVNLLFSLPEVLQSEIYHYDTTYRIFGDSRFKRELADSYLNSKLLRKICLDEITKYLDILIFDQEVYWHNEYGRIDTYDTSQINTPNYKSINDFMVVLHYIGEALYYKILPKGSTPENNSFLRNKNPTNYDGYFLNEHRPTNLTHYDFDKLCIYETDRIEKYDKNFRKIDQQIGMYFA